MIDYFNAIVIPVLSEEEIKKILLNKNALYTYL